MNNSHKISIISNTNIFTQIFIELHSFINMNEEIELIAYT